MALDIFNLRRQLVDQYGDYVGSFIRICNGAIRRHVDQALDRGLLWPDPLVQLNPAFEPGASVDELVDEGVLHEECRRIFRAGKTEADGIGDPLHLYGHQEEAIRAARAGDHYALTTGTGSGKSLAYIVPMVDAVLREGGGRGIRGVVVYPMNALANSQLRELEKFLCHGYGEGAEPVTFARYTGQESREQRRAICQRPPDILLTNYVMLELILTRRDEPELMEAAKGLRFLVLDELHTYRGRQGADVAMLMRRVRDLVEQPDVPLQCVGTSATLAGPGTQQEQQQEVADVASRVFGVEVRQERVIGETLRRATPAENVEDPAFVHQLRQRLAGPAPAPDRDVDEFLDDPLASWIESTLGLESGKDGQLVRAQPKPITGPGGAAARLHELVGVDVDRCRKAIEQMLLEGYRHQHQETGFPAFAFRLHQFISRGDTVYASPEGNGDRYVTVHGQQFVPHDRSKVLRPMAFCRECGQEYYVVRRQKLDAGFYRFVSRDLNDQHSDASEGEAGFLFRDEHRPWPHDDDRLLERVPDDWVEEVNGSPRLRPDRRQYLPAPHLVGPDAIEDGEGTEFWFVPAPFRFCLHCGVSYDFRQRSDYAKLGSLGIDARSTATTILALTAVQAARQAPNFPAKLLSFTDNRQDASLQAGHFNDFVQIGLLRAALYQAAGEAGPDGLSHDRLTQAVFGSMQLPPSSYARQPELRGVAKHETEAAVQDVLGYRLYLDLRRGWRVTSPNLEQVGLLRIEYVGLQELAADQQVWQDCHPALATASPGERAQAARVLLDEMRRELAISVRYLEAQTQQSMQLRSDQRLHEESPWSFEPDERFERASRVLPRSRRPRDSREDRYLSGRSAFGRFLCRFGTFPSFEGRLKIVDAEKIIVDLLEAMADYGIVDRVGESGDESDVPPYQVNAAAMRWVAGDGTEPFRDIVRVPTPPEGGSQANRFFVRFYRELAAGLHGVAAREHTAQVPTQERVKREADFREQRLPVLFCSPTMELGIDIRDLNLVNLRNVPPTPANYAQRSGRAGRSGQPALVFAYCSTGSPHDQYFFKRPELMVSGKVAPPRVDLANEDLLRAHVHAIWLRETGADLGKSLAEVLDLSGDPPSLALLPSKQHDLENAAARAAARQTAESILRPIMPLVARTAWYDDAWLDRTLHEVLHAFDTACERWRSLYRAAWEQQRRQNERVNSHELTHADREEARRLRSEAERQMDLLRDAANVAQPDFYSYRYFASEGFLPGYNFPRLPLSAYIPGRRRATTSDDYLSRPRFLAITEFGPRSLIYHEGSRYIVNKVILPAGDENRPDDTQPSLTTTAKQCTGCGYLHPDGESSDDVCDRCGKRLGSGWPNLFRLRNVVVKRRDRITSDEEERLRLGYEVRSGFRFAQHHGEPVVTTATVVDGEQALATLSYAHAATLWRINLGWARRGEDAKDGFLLDVDRGYWARNPQVSKEEDPEDPEGPRREHVIPYVEDRRNCLLLEPEPELASGREQFISLMTALKQAVQVHYQLEDSELAVEPLPDQDQPRLMLLYEASEGGAGVLRRLVEEPPALEATARRALELCHFDPDSGADHEKAPGATEKCEAACYDCLLSYRNQRDHELLYRDKARDPLMRLQHAVVRPSPTAASRTEHFEQLLSACESELERRWLRWIEGQGLRLPTHAQAYLERCGTRPDFEYRDQHTVIYVDGPHHEFPERQTVDRQQERQLMLHGYSCIRFGNGTDWERVVTEHAHLFGQPTAKPGSPSTR